MATLEKDPPLYPTDIAPIYSDQCCCVNDEKSASKDDDTKNVNNIGKRILDQKCQLVVHCNQDDEYENGFDDEENSEVNSSNTESCQPGPSKSNALNRDTRRVQRVLETQEMCRLL